MTETTPRRIAMCAHPGGPHEHIPLNDDEPAPTTCFMDCDCTPVVFVRDHVRTAALMALDMLNEDEQSNAGTARLVLDAAVGEAS